MWSPVPVLTGWVTFRTDIIYTPGISRNYRRGGGSSNQSYLVEFEGIFSPISERVDTWSHPDKEMLKLILRGLQEGFRIGFSGGSRRQSSGHNMASCLKHPAIVQSILIRNSPWVGYGAPFLRTLPQTFM